MSQLRIKLDKPCRLCRKNRRGAAVVEFAVVLPIFLLLVFGMLEFGRMVMVQQIITNASREGARKAVLDGVEDADVQAAVSTYLTNASISGAPPAVIVTNPPVDPDYAESVTVTVSVPFSQVSWMPTPINIAGYFNSGDVWSKNLAASTTMRKEAVQ